MNSFQVSDSVFILIAFALLLFYIISINNTFKKKVHTKKEVIRNADELIELYSKGEIETKEFTKKFRDMVAKEIENSDLAKFENKKLEMLAMFIIRHKAKKSDLLAFKDAYNHANEVSSELAESFFDKSLAK